VSLSASDVGDFTRIMALYKLYYLLTYLLAYLLTYLLDIGPCQVFEYSARVMLEYK